MHLKSSVLLAGACFLAAPGFAQVRESTLPKPPALAAQPVVEDYFGTKVEDRFRFVEKQEPATVEWMKAQARYTRAVIDSIKPRQALYDRMLKFGGEFGVAFDAEYAGNRLFFEERKPGADAFDLVVREPDGTKRTLVDIAALIKARGYPVAIDSFEPSRDGRLVALRMSEKGSEMSMLTILDVATGRTVAGPERMGAFTSTSWDVDGKSLFFSRLRDPATVPKGEEYLNTQILHWTFGQSPRVIFDPKAGLGPKVRPTDLPFMITPRGTDRAILIIAPGVENEIEAYEAPRADAAAGRANWRQIVRRDDAVTGMHAAPDGLYFLTHKDAPTFKVTKIGWNGTATQANTVLPPQPGFFYDTIAGGKDAIYVGGRERLSGAVWRLPKSGRAPERLSLPAKGTVQALEAESDRDGAIVMLAGYATPITNFGFVSGRGFADLKLETRPPLDLARYQVEETNAPTRDGTEVPLVILATADKGARKPRPFVIDAYGSYGASNLPVFSPRLLVNADLGMGYASCSVRGGGELGEPWRLGGKDANKPNTWRDAIACAEKLIADGWTTPSMLAITGTSAGGIMAGRAGTERPDLFSAVISRVGVSNALRNEQTPGGPHNAAEFGSVTTEAGFRNLLAMDVTQAVKDGVKYPAFMLTTGLEDPRVPPWQVVKGAARLQEAGALALLRIDETSGHGAGTTRSAATAEQADISAFVLWRAGLPDWQPSK